MPLIDELENSTDEEIEVAGNKLAKYVTKKFILGVVISVVVHFASEALVRQIDNRRNHETTE